MKEYTEQERKLAEINGVNLDEPTEEEKQAAQVLFTAIMTDTLIEEEF